MKSSIKTLLIVLGITMFTSIGNATSTSVNHDISVLGFYNPSITDATIINYMSEHGYSVITIAPITGTTNYIVQVSGGKKFIVFTNNVNILGHEEIYIG
jgi:hypothetical protein